MISNFVEGFVQNEAFATLTTIYNSNRIPHAFIFSGKEGVGKHSTAIEFAKLLNSNLPDEKRRIINRKIQCLEEPFVKYIFPLPRGKGETGDDTAYQKLPKDAIEQIQNEIKIKTENPFHTIRIDKANSIKINSIREIRKFISIGYDDVKYRFIIINDAHLMQDEAQNALLKGLEEPPEGIIFILLTPYVDKLLPTILSRCWKIDFKPLQRTIVQEVLENKFKLERDTAQKVSFFSDGSVTEGYRLSQKNFEEIIVSAINLLRFALAGRYNTAFKHMNEFLEDSPKESMNLLIGLIMRWLNDTVKNRNDLQDYYFENYSETLVKFNKKFNHADVLNVYEHLEEQQAAISKNVSLNVIAMNIIFDIASIAMR
ncbi:MAG: hypothetical protein KKA84_00255 [Bacteroidetes bacterium]|nr:hypothetical protein [Bacteroidota bacterium]